MNAKTNWLNLPAEQQKRYINTIGVEKGLSVETIEKDWWVTTVLRALFSAPFAEHLSLKGGTSLSKCWNLIERFSEDIDITINREFLGYHGNLSNTKINNGLRRDSCTFVKGRMRNEIENQLINSGIDKSFFEIEPRIKLNNKGEEESTTDPQIIEVHYQSIFPPTNYVQNKVLIEVSGRSMNEPVEKIEINSMISQYFPNAKFADDLFLINVVSPRRTFLEKACLLHEEFAKDVKDIRVERMSRHLYDLEKLMDTKIAQEAIEDTELYKAIIAHRQKFVGLKGFDYSTLMPQSISLVPPIEVLLYWKEDYKNMQSTMIYGASLPFDKLIERIKELNERFRNINF
ncbi:nucleotidyltransferase [Bacteroidia bacterium]|nr:nucleotidyltransferase [Bacteroidia bacterium]